MTGRDSKSQSEFMRLLEDGVRSQNREAAWSLWNRIPGTRINAPDVELSAQGKASEASGAEASEIADETHAALWEGFNLVIQETGWVIEGDGAAHIEGVHWRGRIDAPQSRTMRFQRMQVARGHTSARDWDPIWVEVFDTVSARTMRVEILGILPGVVVGTYESEFTLDPKAPLRKTLDPRTGLPEEDIRTIGAVLAKASVVHDSGLTRWIMTNFVENLLGAERDRDDGLGPKFTLRGPVDEATGSIVYTLPPNVGSADPFTGVHGAFGHWRHWGEFREYRRSKGGTIYAVKSEAAHRRGLRSNYPYGVSNPDLLTTTFRGRDRWMFYLQRSYEMYAEGGFTEAHMPRALEFLKNFEKEYQKDHERRHANRRGGNR